MDPALIGLLSFVCLLVLIGLGIPIAFAITAVATFGMASFIGLHAAAVQFFTIAFTTGSEFLIASVPLFILMGQLVSHARIGEDLYEGVYKWFGRLPGGLAVTSVVSCAGFGAVTGVSSAAVATMARIVMPEMRRYGYDMRLSAGSIASAATLAIMVPPSLLLVLYGLWTETSIGQLFIAGLVPAVVMVCLFTGYILVRCAINPALGPAGPRFPLRERLAALVKLLPVVIIFVIVIGGIYSGIFTPGEAAGIGAFAVFVVALVMRRLTWKSFVQAIYETAQLSVMIFAIFIAVTFISRFLIITGVTTDLISLIAAADTSRYVIFAMLVVLYLVLGAILDAFGMLLLTLPFVFPVVVDLGFDPVWFGVIVTVLTEVALVTPPVGFNVYILNRISPEISLQSIFAGVTPFVVLALMAIALFTVFPGLVLWLPRMAF